MAAGANIPGVSRSERAFGARQRMDRVVVARGVLMLIASCHATPQAAASGFVHLIQIRDELVPQDQHAFIVRRFDGLIDGSRPSSWNSRDLTV